MKREQLSGIIGNIDDRHIAEAVQYNPGPGKRSPERITQMKKKRLFTLAVAAVLVFALSIGAYAKYASIATPEAAQNVAGQELGIWKQMGLLSQDVNLEGVEPEITEIEESVGNDYWYGRLFTHSYQVLWTEDKAETQKYNGFVDVDTLSGKITELFICAKADADAVPVKTDGEYSFYDNYGDIFPEDMTVDRFCTLLAEYWGFSGYSLAETVDDFYATDYEAIDGSTLLKDLNNVTGENYYLTVFFEGDQEGAPMYVQIEQYPDYVALIVGTGHAVG